MVSVVIPAFNEEKFILNCLNSLKSQKTSRKYEVIVVDNNSTDKTSQIVREFTGLDLKLVKESKKGRGFARKSGFKKAQGEIILSTDADTTVPEDWIEKLVQSFDEDQVVGVTGTFKIQDQGMIKNTIFNLLMLVSTYLYWILHGYFWFYGGSFAVKREIYFQSGEFNVDFHGMQDVELASRVEKLGTIKFNPQIIVIASGRRFNQGFFAGLGEYGRNFVNFNLYHKNQINLSDKR